MGVKAPAGVTQTVLEDAVATESTARVAGDVAARSRANHTGTQDPTTINGTAVVASQLTASETASRARSNHTGTQAATTITGLAQVATTGNASHLSGRIAETALPLGVRVDLRKYLQAPYTIETAFGRTGMDVPLEQFRLDYADVEAVAVIPLGHWNVLRNHDHTDQPHHIVGSGWGGRFQMTGPTTLWCTNNIPGAVFSLAKGYEATDFSAVGPGAQFPGVTDAGGPDVHWSSVGSYAPQRMLIDTRDACMARRVSGRRFWSGFNNGGNHNGVEDVSFKQNVHGISHTKRVAGDARWVTEKRAEIKAQLMSEGLSDAAATTEAANRLPRTAVDISHTHGNFIMMGHVDLVGNGISSQMWDGRSKWDSSKAQGANVHMGGSPWGIYAEDNDTGGDPQPAVISNSVVEWEFEYCALGQAYLGNRDVIGLTFVNPGVGVIHPENGPAPGAALPAYQPPAAFDPAKLCMGFARIWDQITIRSRPGDPNNMAFAGVHPTTGNSLSWYGTQFSNWNWEGADLAIKQSVETEYQLFTYRTDISEGGPLVGMNLWTNGGSDHFTVRRCSINETVAQAQVVGLPEANQSIQDAFGYIKEAGNPGGAQGRWVGVHYANPLRADPMIVASSPFTGGAAVLNPKDGSNGTVARRVIFVALDADLDGQNRGFVDSAPVDYAAAFTRANQLVTVDETNNHRGHVRPGGVGDAAGLQTLGTTLGPAADGRVKWRVQAGRA
jgi:hypothetical protein